jgi:hypothetical protein
MEVIPLDPPRWVSGIYGAITVVVTATYLIAMFGLDNADVIAAADFQALQTYQATASPYSYLMALSYGDLPISVNFPAVASHFTKWNYLLTPAEVRASAPTRRDAAVLARKYSKYATANGGQTNELYAIWSPPSVEYSVDYGLETLRQAEAWRSAMIASPDWQVVYSSDGTYLFRVKTSALGRAHHAAITRDRG